MIASTSINQTHATARQYARRGWHVLPLYSIREDGTCTCDDPECHSPGKHPMIGGGLKNATRDSEQIDEWYESWPGANLGVRTGSESGVVVLDVDLKSDGPGSLKKLIVEHGPLPKTVQAITGSGGSHYFFKHPGGVIKNRTAVRPGLDFRGDQGYVVVPPSKHVSGGGYRWVEGRTPDDLQPASMPDWLLKLVTPPTTTAKPQRVAGKQVREMKAAPPTDKTHPELLKAAGRYAAKVPNVGEGQRNQAAFNLAGHLAAFAMKDTGETIDEDDLLDLVSVWNEQNDPPLDDNELKLAVKSALVNGTPREPKLVEPEDEDAEGEVMSPATALVRLTEERADLFHAPGVSGECYATVNTNKGSETYGINRRAFKSWLLLQFRKEFDAVPGEQAMREAITMIDSIAEHDRGERQVWRRVGEQDDAVWIDLCDEEHRVVRIDPRGWKIVTDSDVRFLRGGGMEPLPVPESGGKMDLLRKYVNVSCDDDWALLLAWLISPFLVGGPYPCLIVNGEQGSAKTTLTRTVLALTDPAKAQLRAAPPSERDLMIRAGNTHVIAYDNISSVQPWFSNALCRLATGGGFGTRRLYANDEELILDIKQSVILNGIEEFVTASDLLDRSVLLQLESIPESDRRTESSIQQEFERDRPLILGALFDAVSTALRRRGRITLNDSPRMADFATWATAAEPALGLKDGDIVAALMRRRQDTDQVAIENNIIGPYLMKFLSNNPKWSGTATQLLDALNGKRFGMVAGVDHDPTRNSRYWPKSPRALSAHLDKLRPVLRRLGYDFSRDKQSDRTRTRMITFSRVMPKPADKHAARPELKYLADASADVGRSEGHES